MLISSGFWDEVERYVSSEVDDALKTNDTPRELLISYLRDLEVMARTACERRQTIQIIASGRSILGDRTIIEPREGPFTNAVA